MMDPEESRSEFSGSGSDDGESILLPVSYYTKLITVNPS